MEEGKQQQQGQGQRAMVLAGVAHHKGSRTALEDTAIWAPPTAEAPLTAYAGVFDGHGGAAVAESAKKKLHAIAQELGVLRCWKKSDKANGEVPNAAEAKKRVVQAFERCDREIVEAQRKKAMGADQTLEGATAVCAWFLKDVAIVANIGDARAVLACETPLDSSHNNGSHATADAAAAKRRKLDSDGNSEEQAKTETKLKSKVVSLEHKALNTDERIRIEKAGGFVDSAGRVGGRVEVSRAFGDSPLKGKNGGICATPHVRAFRLTSAEKFLVLACDGLFTAFTPQELVDVTAKYIAAGYAAAAAEERRLEKNAMKVVAEEDRINPLEEAARRLVTEAAEGRKCHDNCTAMILTFPQNH